MIHEGFKVSASSVLRALHRKDAYKPYKPTKKRHDKFYHTPDMIHEKWQVDVKFVPSECNIDSSKNRFYQYTILDEATRKRVLYFTNEHSMYETVQALKNAIKEFGFKPNEIQTDNGFEFTDTVRRKTTGKNIRQGDNYLEIFLKSENIQHHLIKPRTPEHNGKVERSHRIDQDKFYKNLRFYSLKDLRIQGKAWNKRYNNMPKIILGFKSPNEIEVEKLKELLETTGEIGCKKCLTSFES